MRNLMAMAADQLLAAKPATVYILTSEYMAGGTDNGEAYCIEGVYATRESAREGLADWKADHGDGHAYEPEDGILPDDEEDDDNDTTEICGKCGWDASITEHGVHP